MRELDDEYGDRPRHARDAEAGPSVDAYLRRPHDSPRQPQAGHQRLAPDDPRLVMLNNAAARAKARRDYDEIRRRQETAFAAEHAKPESADQVRSPERRDRLAQDREIDAALAAVSERTSGLPAQSRKKQKPERSWFPRADIVSAISDAALFGTAIAVALGDASARWDAVAVAGAKALVSFVGWGNRRWKGKHGDRPES